MKSWEDILRQRFSDHAAPGKPGEDAALWDAIEGRLPPPVAVPPASSASGATFGSGWSWLGIAAAIGTVVLAVSLWPASDAPVNEADVVESPSMPAAQPSQDVDPSGNVDAMDVAAIEAASEMEASSFDANAANASDAAGAEEGENLAMEDDAGGVGVQERESTTSLGAAAEQDEPVASVTQAVAAGDAQAGDVERGIVAVGDAAGGRPEEVRPGFVEPDDGEASLGGEASEVKSALARTVAMLPPLKAGGLPDMKAGPLLLPMPEVPHVGAPLALRVHGGLTFSHFTFNDDRPADLSGYFHTDFSTGGGVALEFERWGQAFSAGVAWYDYVHRLEYVEVTPHEVVDPMGIQSLEINALTGDTVAVHLGEVVGTAERHRFIRSYNRFNAVVIPIEWRQERSRGRWSAGLGLGGQLVVRSGGHGHSLSRQGTIEAYADRDLPQSRLNWTPTARAYFGFQVEPEWRLDMSFGAGVQRFRSRRSEGGNFSEATTWDGRLVTGQLQCGLTRFLAYRSGRKERPAR